IVNLVRDDGAKKTQLSRRLLSLSFGEVPSPARRALNALKRPTFGEGSFERFKGALTSATSEPSGSSIGHDQGSDLPSPSSPGHHHHQYSTSGGRSDERPRTYSKVGGSRLRSSTIGERIGSDTDTKKLGSSSKRPAT
ncbi:7718_t:CDS:1, partial [Acaulospora colombiana]